MYFLTKLALKNTWVTYLLTAILAGVCLWGTLTLKQELLPDIELPMMTVVTVYPQAQPEEVMNDVTIPIESAVKDIPRLKHVTSTSVENTSVVFIEFEYGTKMDDVIRTVKENVRKLDLPQAVLNAPSQIPSITENPRIVPINLNSMPVLTFSLNGDVPLSDLVNIAQLQIVPVLSQINGVFGVNLDGVKGEEIIVIPKIDKMSQLGISTAQLVGMIMMNEYDSIDSIRNAPVGPGGLTLQQLADISLGPEPSSSIVRTNGKPSITISVTKTADANTVITADAVVEESEKLQAALPEGIQLVTIFNQSAYIKNSVQNLTNDALIGGALAVLVVFLFLLAVRASIVTAISIPMSVLIGFLIMHFANITVNILTLSAMTLAIGRVIDDSIVMVEVTYRRIQAGEKFPQATLNGAKEIVNAITSATITTVIIFVPLALVGGIVGAMFVPFALTVTFTMFGSLISALTIVPALTRLLSSGKEKVRLGGGNPWYQRIYTKALRWCLGHRAATLIVALVIFAGSVGLLPIIGTSFMPEINTSVVNVSVQMPKDASTDEFNKTIADVEAVLAGDSNVTSYTTTIGISQSSLAYMMFSGGVGTGAEITITIADGISTREATEAIIEELGVVQTRGTVSVESVEAMSTGGASVDLSVRGANLVEIGVVANDLAQQLGQIEGIGEREVVVGNVVPKVVITPDPTKIAMAGMIDQVSMLQGEFMLLLRGGTAGNTTIDSQSYPVYIVPAVQLAAPDVLKALNVGSGKTAPLGTVASVEVVEAPTELKRIDQKLAASVNAPITATNVGAVNKSVQKVIDEMELPGGVEIASGGIFEDMQESFFQMFISILVAMVLSYGVLVVTFRSFLKSAVIMASLPLATIGAFFALLITGHTLGVIGLMGILMLVGIVLTNAVVLIAYVEQLRTGGLSLREALITGGGTRLRPILMTALTTLIAMVPMALGLGEGVIVASELAIVVIGGLFSSTLLTLLVVPVIYSIVYGRKEVKKV
jgi:HAE1 family hydrophobic/amphiphilic exporter-1